jgi:DNA helicase-2/ATP-dependent DNA helicase PcrA
MAALHPAVADRLARLAPDQRAAATAPPGPILCVAPAGSGKTTTLVARICWLIATGNDPAAIAAITFNNRAAAELRERLATAIAPLGLGADAVRVRTFHALGREILADAGESVETPVDRAALLRELFPGITPGAIRRLDDAFSRIKLDLGLGADDVRTMPDPGPIVRAFIAYEGALARDAALDFDDLVGRTIRVLEGRGELLGRWRRRTGHLLVDEVQDVDRSQLRLALVLAAPANRVFLVGDDDQSIYGWRLADVRRVLELDTSLPGLRRVDLVTNYRCPGPVVDRAVRLIECNRERFAKRIVARPSATGRIVFAPDSSDDHVRLRRIVATIVATGAGTGTAAVLARTNRELLPAASAAIELGVPFRASGLRLLVESPEVDRILDRIASEPPAAPFLLRLAKAARSGPIAADDATTATPAGVAVDTRIHPDDVHAEADAEVDAEVAAIDPATVRRSILAWAAPYRSLEAFRAAVASTRARLAELRRDDANFILATAHGTKGLEFDHVAVVGLDSGRFPSARSVADSADPGRALEEERRLAYVAWTRARRTLVLSYDPSNPSPFLREAFEAEELGLGEFNRRGFGAGRSA